MSTAQISVRVDTKIKQLASKKAKSLGISLSSLYKIFLEHFVKNDNFVTFQLDENIWNAHFSKQKTYSKISKTDEQNIKLSQEDVKKRKLQTLKPNQKLSDLM